MQLLVGKSLSDNIQVALKSAVEHTLQNQPNARKPHLAAIHVGDNHASAAYIRNKIRACEAAGFDSSLIHLDAEISETSLLAEIEKLNQNPNIDGFIVQLPLPKHIDENKIIFAISPEKDVDGFHPQNLGKLMLGLETFVPATPLGIMQLLEHYNIETTGKHCVVIGRSNIVGTPISILLSRNNKIGNCTVTLTHSKTQDLAQICRQADILIAAIGKANFVTADMVKPGAVIIDVGINSIDAPEEKNGYKLVGDVDFEAVAPLVSAITPVPRGVGAMTVAALLLNTWKSYTKTFNLEETLKF